MTTTSSLIQIRCGSLRSKSSYGAFEEFHEDLNEIMGASTTFWCLKTMGKAGPDEHFVHRSVCVKGRSCWHSNEDPT
jgi:hypothetical protein